MRIPFLVVGLVLVAALLVGAQPATAQGNGPVAPRITQAVDENNLTTLRGNTHPLARPQYDRGLAPDALPMERMLLVLKRSAQQEAALQTLLDQQQDKSSPNYHRWLTPQQFGPQFGPTDADIQTVTGWLQSHGFQVAGISNGRTAIEFTGTAGQVRDALHTEIHRYVVNGEQHWANASDPQIPTALTPVVAGVNSLHNFPKRSLHHVTGLFSKSKATGEVKPLAAASSNRAGTAATPAFSFPFSQCSPTGNTCYAVGPYDFATIYNVLPLWNRTPAIDGTGQTIAIVGQSNIDLQDVANFRTLFGLPGSNPQNIPQIIVNGSDPGFVSGDETESDLDVEWSGAIAKGATIKFVTSATTNAEAGIDLSALYIVDNDIAPVLSESYGACELFLGTDGNLFYSEVWEQAAAEGITVVISAGDGGSATCDGNESGAYAIYGLSVNGLASTPFNVAVGGTDFLYPNNNPAPYWNASNNAMNQSSVNPNGSGGIPYAGYIPETTWNDSCTNPLTFLYTGVPFTTAAANCNNSTVINDGFLTVTGGGGGQSNCTTSDGVHPTTCAPAFGKPAWQTKLTPADQRRDLPDVSLFASNGMNGSFYVICEQDLNPDGNSCNLNSPYTDFVGLGGTSSSAPDFAGIMALVNQYTSSSFGQGNANYTLYQLAANLPAAFNDVTNGTIAMPCGPGSPNCSAAAGSGVLGVLSGFSAGVGYDLATGLGSVNAQTLVTNWNTAAGTGGFTATSTTLTLNNGGSLSNLAHGTPVPVSITVAPTTGAGTPTGDVSLVAEGLNSQPAPLGAGIDVYTLTSGKVAGSAGSCSTGENAGTCYLPGGTYDVVAHYAGDGTFGPSTSAPVQVTVSKENSAIALCAFSQVNSTTGAHLCLDGGSVSYGTAISLRADTGPSSNNAEDSVPTGSVTFFDNCTSAAIPGNPYALNSIGTAFTPYGIGTFSTGSHSIIAGYGGDSSYNSSSSSSSAITSTACPASASNFTITSAPTTTTVLPSASTIPPGQPVSLTAAVSATNGSSGNPPTGTITFSVGSTQLGSPATTLGYDSSGNAFIIGTITTSQLPTGTDTVTVKFTSADANYESSTGSANVSVTTTLISTTTTISTFSTTAVEGTPVTFTAEVTPSKGGPVMTADVELLVDGIPVGGVLAVASIPVTFPPINIPPGSHTVSAAYLGDSNYAGSVSTSNITETMTGPDFTITPGSGSIAISNPGASNSVTLMVAGKNGYNTTLFFYPSSCIITPGGSFSSCSFSPSSITGSGATTVTILTSGPATTMLSPHPYTPFGPNLWMLGGSTGLAAILWFVFPPKRRRWSTAFGVLVFALVATFVGCGGGGGSSSGNSSGSTTTPASTPTNVTYTVNVLATPSSGQVTHAAHFTFTVQ